MNCLSGSQKREPRELHLKPYADIAGIGIIIAFVVTAYLTFSLSLAYYFFEFEPEARHTTGPSSNANDPQDRVDKSYANPIDVRIVRSFRQACYRLNNILPFLPTVNKLDHVLSIVIPDSNSIFFVGPLALTYVTQSILQLCDSQLLTGIAILLSGFLSLHFGTPEGDDISAFHWYMIVQLAWFSYVSNLSGLTIIRLHLHHRTQERNFRLLWLIPLFTLLLTALIPTAWFNWGTPGGWSVTEAASGAKDLFNIKKTGALLNDTSALTVFLSVAFQSMVCSLLMMTIGLLNRLAKLSKTASYGTHRYIRSPISTFFQNICKCLVLFMRRSRIFRRATILIDFTAIYSAACFLTLRVLADLLCSTLTEILWLLGLLVWGTMNLLQARAGMAWRTESPPKQRHNLDVIAAENQWTFGQTLPVLLLSVPVFNTLSLFITGMCNKETALQDVRHRQQWSYQTNDSPGACSLEDERENIASGSSEPIVAARQLNLMSSNNSYTLGSEDPSILNGNHDWTPDLHRWLSKKYYKTAPWLIGACFGSTLAWLFALGFVLRYVKDPRDCRDSSSILGTLIGSPGILYYAMVAVPNALVWTIAIGITLENHRLAKATNRYAPALFFLLSTTLNIAFAFSVTWLSPLLLVSSFGPPSATDGLSYIGEYCQQILASQLLALTLFNAAYMSLYVGVFIACRLIRRKRW